MSLTDHARAARIMADAFTDAGASDVSNGFHESATVSLAIAAGYELAAQRMEQAVCDEAQTLAGGHRCTIDHRKMTAPKCPACSAPRG